MWADQQIHPTVTPATQGMPTTTPGLTFKQHAAVLILAGMYANPHYAPFRSDEMAKEAKTAAERLAAEL